MSYIQESITPIIFWQRELLLEIPAWLDFHETVGKVAAVEKMLAFLYRIWDHTEIVLGVERLDVDETVIGLSETANGHCRWHTRSSKAQESVRC